MLRECELHCKRLQKTLRMSEQRCILQQDKKGHMGIRGYANVCKAQKIKQKLHEAQRPRTCKQRIFLRAGCSIAAADKARLQ
jgi:hypothetical protein